MIFAIQLKVQPYWTLVFKRFDNQTIPPSKPDFQNLYTHKIWHNWWFNTISWSRNQLHIIWTTKTLNNDTNSTQWITNHPSRAWTRNKRIEMINMNKNDHINDQEWVLYLLEIIGGSITCENNTESHHNQRICKKEGYGTLGLLFGANEDWN